MSDKLQVWSCGGGTQSRTPEFGFMEGFRKNKISSAIEYFRMAAESGPVNLYHSGGKDSVVLDELAKESGIEYRKIYHVTTIDPPELVRFVRTCGVWMKHPGTSFIKLVSQNGLPTRWRRWCCKKLKHGKSEPGVSVVGVRASESASRKANWKHVQTNDRGWVICPILDWSTSDIWNFIRQKSLPYCCLYDRGFKRIGCIGCPLTGCPDKELRLYPRIKEGIRLAWMKYCETHDTVDDPERAWEGWLEAGRLYGENPPEGDECQMKYLFVGGDDDDAT